MVPISVAVVFAALLIGSGLIHQQSKRVFNFSAGPSAVLDSVLLRARKEMLNYHGTGAAVFEQSHRDADGPVQKMIVSAAAKVRRLLDVPDTHAVLYMHGGAHGQFAGLPLNLCTSPNQTATYVTTGFWSQRALDEGSRQHKKTEKIDGTLGNGLASPLSWKISEDSCFVHFCASETIDSLEYFEDPKIREDVPLVGDFTSTLLSRPVDFSKYGVVYASGGKNLGPAGFVLVIVRQSLLNRVRNNCPSILSWKAHAETKPIPSIYNTPPVINLWLHDLTMDEYERWGGMKVLAERVQRRKNKVYAEIDDSDFYVMPVAKNARSAMSVSMTIAVGGVRREDLEQAFVRESANRGLIQLFGHPVRGGLRITLYHGISDEAVDELIQFMREFKTKRK